MLSPRRRRPTAGKVSTAMVSRSRAVVVAAARVRSQRSGSADPAATTAILSRSIGATVTSRPAVAMRADAPRWSLVSHRPGDGQEPVHSHHATSSNRRLRESSTVSRPR